MNDAEPETPQPLGARVHHEPARTYTSVWVLLVLLVAGFLVDVALGGAMAHLPGWLIAAALVLGVDVLLVHAARSTRSLLVTTDQLWVGDEMLPRSEIAGANVGVDRDLPVLGWPTGLPRLTRGVTVRLRDEREVVVPARNPDRLRDVLAVDATPPRTAGDPRPATDADLAVLEDIDDRAEIVFRLAGYALPAIQWGDDYLAEAKAIFVIDDPPVGFVLVIEIDSLAHIEEIGVLPGAMKRGVGTRLLERACEWARDEQYPAITLTTYADVPWNGPWYRARGFVEVTDLTPGLAAVREHEAELGLDGVGRRIVMRRDLRSAPPPGPGRVPATSG